MQLTALDYLAAAGAAGAAGAINALAGGGTLVSFPTLVAIGVPPVTANVTNTVALLPGYLAAVWAQRDDLRPQLHHSRVLAVVAVAGGLGGSVLLVSITGQVFRAAVPYLILASCLLLLGQDRLREFVRPAETHHVTGGPPTAPAPGAPGRDAPADIGVPAGTDVPLNRDSPPAALVVPVPATHWGPLVLAAVFGAAVYGGFFGAGLGIVLLAVLGLFSVDSLIQVNALKQLLSFVINLVAAVFFAFSGHVQWELVPVMAAASVLGGSVGGRLVQVIDAGVLRRLVVIAGIGVAVAFWAA